MSNVSFEFFPPRTEKAASNLAKNIEILTDYAPELMTVTFGAGGSSKDNTANIVEELSAKYDIPVASHLTYCGLSKKEIADYANNIHEKGIRHIIALRGDDWNSDGQKPAFNDTAEFITWLKQEYDFKIGVGCYPETHPYATSAEQDLISLKSKQDAGADFAISQYFFENDIYYDFSERAQRVGIDFPIIPGILPIHNLEQVAKFSEKCGATVPQFIFDTFEKGRAEGVEDIDIARDIVTKQAKDLAGHGISDLHIYTMNKAALSTDIIDVFKHAHGRKAASLAAE